MKTNSTHQPLSLRISRTWLLLLGALTFAIGILLAFFVGVTPSFNTFDYPIDVVNAARTLNGEKPYVDFEAYYGPLGPYLAAAGTGVIKTFLPLIPAFNLFHAICAVVYFALVLWPLRELIPRRFGVYLALIIYIILIMPIAARYAYYTLIPVSMLIVIIQCSRKVFASDITFSQAFPFLLAMAGVAVITFFTRINFGVYAMGALAVVGGGALITQREKIWRTLAILAAAIALLMGIAALVLYCSGILLTFIHDFISFMPRYKARLLPPPFDSVQVILLLIIAATLLFLALNLAWKKRFGGGVLGTIITFGVYEYTVQRYDIEHALPLLLLFPTIFLAIERDSQVEGPIAASNGKKALHKKHSSPSLWIRRILLGLMLLLAASFFDTSNSILNLTASYWRYCFNHHHFFVDDTVLILPNETKMLQELAGNPDTNTEIFWGSLPGCCESTTQMGANLALYLSQGRLPVTKYWVFDPCSTAHSDIQEILISELEQKKIKCIGMQGLIDPQLNYLPGNPPEATLFFNYVVANYAFLKRYTMPEANRYYDVYIRKTPFKE